MVSQLKRLLVKPGLRPTTIKFGLGKNLQMMIDPAHKTQRIYGLDEAEIASVVERYARRAKTIVDVGANDGYYTLTTASLNREATCYACDPQAGMREKCAENLELNGLKLEERIYWISDLIGTGSPDQGKFLSLDDLLRNAAEPIFIKMDIDGGELNALKSGNDTLKGCNCLLVVETHSPELERDCIAYLESLGYACRIIPNAWWRAILPEERPLDHNRWFAAEKGTSA